jgi:hypothetical protein
MSIHFAGWPLNLKASLSGATALCVWLALGCSDDSHRLGGGTDVTRTGVQTLGTCAHGADVEVIDQMEDGDGTIETTERRGGVWFSFNDKTDGTQIPDPYAEVFSMAELDPPRAGSRFAARSHGGGFSDWGAGIGFELFNQKAYDLSRYAGITFWARRSPGAYNKVRFAVTDSATAPRGGQCHEYADYSTCSDYFGSELSLSTEFRRYTLYWSDLTQQGWGDPRPDSVNTSEIYGVRFQSDAVESFDFWVDDIALLCHPD